MDQNVQLKIVTVYRDASKAELIAEIPIMDYAALTPFEGNFVMEDPFIVAAKIELRARAISGIKSFHYEVMEGRASA